MAESKVKRENYITISGWMVTELKLKGNELLIYAIIYGFSQDEESRFTGSLQYLADWTNSTRRGVMKSLQSLCEKGLLQKTDIIKNGVKFCEYHGTKFTGVWNKVHRGVEQSSPGGVEQSSHNILDINNIDNNIEDKREGEPRTQKHKYGEFKNVLLTDEELKKLQTEHEDWSEAIEHLSQYLEMTGKPYKSHYLVLLKWVFDAVKEKKKKRNSTKETGTNGVPIKSADKRLGDLDDIF